MVSTRRRHLRRLCGVGLSLGASLLSGCRAGVPSESDRAPVRVGSKPFAEQEILGYLAFERLQRVETVQAVDEIGYGGSLANWKATAAGEKHLYWEYTGTAWSRLPPRHDSRIQDPRRLYERVRREAREQGIEMGPPASFSNEWVLVADREWSEQTDVTTIGEFASYVADGNTDFGVAFNEDFYHRNDAWEGLATFYRIDREVRAELTSGTFYVTSVNLMYELLAEGRVAVASGFATDPQLQRSSVVVLEDDSNYFMPYQPAPTAHAPTVRKHEVVLEALSPVVSALDEATIRRLNGRVIHDGETPQAVARSFLEDAGILA